MELCGQAPRRNGRRRVRARLNRATSANIGRPEKKRLEEREKWGWGRKRNPFSAQPRFTRSEFLYADLPVVWKPGSPPLDSSLHLDFYCSPFSSEYHARQYPSTLVEVQVKLNVIVTHFPECCQGDLPIFDVLEKKTSDMLGLAFSSRNEFTRRDALSLFPSHPPNSTILSREQSDREAVRERKIRVIANR